MGKTIPKDIVEKIKKDAAGSSLKGINGIFPISYTLGEFPLEKGAFKWTEFYPEAAMHPLPDEKPDPEIMERYHGIATRQANGVYRIKANVYGYEAEQFGDLSEYVLEGTICPEEMVRQNQVVFKTIMDGGGYYDGIDLHPGDKITLKAPKDAFLAAILFFISLLHATNSMKHQILARRYEYGVLRAIGMTEQKFRRMLIAQGALYGLGASAFMMALLLLCQSVLGSVLQHVIRYIIVNNNISLFSCAAITMANMAVCILAMLACGKELLKETIVDEIKL